MLCVLSLFHYLQVSSGSIVKTFPTPCRLCVFSWAIMLQIISTFFCTAQDSSQTCIHIQITFKKKNVFLYPKNYPQIKKCDSLRNLVTPNLLWPNPKWASSQPARSWEDICLQMYKKYNIDQVDHFIKTKLQYTEWDTVFYKKTSLLPCYMYFSSRHSHQRQRGHVMYVPVSDRCNKCIFNVNASSVMKPHEKISLLSCNKYVHSKAWKYVFEPVQEKGPGDCFDTLTLKLVECGLTQL